jgi:DNA helicase-2/ATP-dependent DNA helicase PcrA
MQLALYRLAWAAHLGVPVDDVGAAFVIVGTGEVVRPDTNAEVSLLLAQ